MSNKYLPNRELQVLNSDTDFFGHIDKGNAIISFLNSNIDEVNQMSMIALYGKWGSGKSTLMRYIGNHLDKGDFKSLYFPAWEFEKDENLPLSLTHFITNETGISGEKGVDVFLKNAGEVLKSLGKGLSVDAKILKFDLANVINSEEDYYKKEAERNESRYTKTKEFKEKFKVIEKVISEKNHKKKTIIFIDDLDRCEPENVLMLLSTIKLFFTYSSDIIFMFGCDKDAIAKAVQHKYGTVIKADEYLEKIIDVSFTMPYDISISKLLSHYFPGNIEVDDDVISVAEFYEKFFQTINFINPRQLKKVLNKYEIICNFKTHKELSKTQIELIPNVIVGNEGDLMETLFTLYFIILFEFHNDTFIALYNYDRKIMRLSNAYMTYYNSVFRPSKLRNFGESKDSLFENGLLLKGMYQQLDSIVASIVKKNTTIDFTNYNTFLALFLPYEHIEILDIRESGFNFIEQFHSNKNSQGDELSLKFCEYLIMQKQIVLLIDSKYEFGNFFEMCRVLL